MVSARRCSSDSPWRTAIAGNPVRADESLDEIRSWDAGISESGEKRRWTIFHAETLREKLSSNAAGLTAWLADRLQRPLPSVDPGSLGAPELSYGRHLMPPLPNSRRAAVLILLYPSAVGWTLPLTLRPETLSVHAGQVSLPGGRIHTRESPEQAACREFEEELGVSAAEFPLLGRLSPLFVYGSNFFVQPCVATTGERPRLEPNPSEVERVVELPLAELFNESRHGCHWIRRNEIRFRAPHLLWDGCRIWGATRMILGELISALLQWND